MKELKVEYTECRKAGIDIKYKGDTQQLVITLETGADPGVEQDCDQLAWSGKTIAVPYRQLPGGERYVVGTTRFATSVRGYRSTLGAEIPTVRIQCESPAYKVEVKPQDYSDIARKVVTKAKMSSEEREAYRQELEDALMRRVEAGRAAFQTLWLAFCDATSFDVVLGTLPSAPKTGTLPGLEG